MASSKYKLLALLMMNEKQNKVIILLPAFRTTNVSNVGHTITATTYQVVNSPQDVTNLDEDCLQNSSKSIQRLNKPH